jgi:hypothetical protein
VDIIVIVSAALKHTAVTVGKRLVKILERRWGISWEARHATRHVVHWIMSIGTCPVHVVVLISATLESAIISVLHGRLVNASEGRLVGISVGHAMHVVHGIMSIGSRAMQVIIFFAYPLEHATSVLHGWLRAIHGGLRTIHGRLGTIRERLRSVRHRLVSIREGLLRSVSSRHCRHHLVMRLNKRR